MVHNGALLGLATVCHYRWPGRRFSGREDLVAGSWVIRAGRPDGLDMAALGECLVIAGWSELGDLSQCRSSQEVRACLAAAYPADGTRRLGSHAGQLWRFLAVMRPGDYVAMPMSHRPGWMAVGRIVGRYRYRPDALPGHRHVRAVEWINTAVPRDAPLRDLSNSLRSIMTIFSLPPDPEGRRLAALAKGEPDPGPAPRAGDTLLSQHACYRASVLDVGDGACSVIRTRRDGRESVTVVDCGSDSISADEACDRLLDAIDGRPELIETIVVTHFDADHYLGFGRLAERMRARGQRFRSLRLISPRPPDVAPQFTASYLAMAITVTGVRSLDLALQLEKVTDGRFRYTPVARSPANAFLAGGRGYEVLWPLAKLPLGVTRQVQHAVREFEELARSLAESGNTALRDNFEAARSGRWLQPREDVTQGSVVSGSYPAELHDPVDLDLLEEADDFDSRLDIDRLNVPEHLQEDFRVVWDSMRRANNNMSMVFEDAEPGRLIAFGDAGAPVLSWLAKTDLCPAHYALMLAPHHGTHPLPEPLRITADLCVAQNGTKRAHLWLRHHRTHRNDGCCVSSRSGSYHLLL